MNTHPVTVDVRDDIRSGREPFSKIMKAVAGLRAEEHLVLIAPFEPAPLIGVLQKTGFSYTGKRTPSGDWESLFTRQTVAQKAEAVPKVAHASSNPATALSSRKVLKVDARGLEPPQPLAKILETVTNLPTNAELLAHTDRRPIHLYSHLEERGFTAQTEEQSDGSFITQIRRQ